MMKNLLVFAIIWPLAIGGSGCMNSNVGSRTFEEDVAFLRRHTDVVVLRNAEQQVAIVPQYQGRVMTSTTSGQSGKSFGWLNYGVIEKGFLPEEVRAGKLEDHIYVFGGEERFWIGPEGGQFSVFFEPGVSFEFANWKTPPSIDTLPYSIGSQTQDSIVFTHDCELLNYSGTTFSVGIKRTIRLLGDTGVAEMLKQALPDNVEYVAYESDNVLMNRGDQSWTKNTGMLSIWILGMYKPSPETTVVIPFKKGSEQEYGPIVNDTYFGKVPSEYIAVTENTIFCIILFISPYRY